MIVGMNAAEELKTQYPHLSRSLRAAPAAGGQPFPQLPRPLSATGTDPSRRKAAQLRPSVPPIPNQSYSSTLRPLLSSPSWRFSLLSFSHSSHGFSCIRYHRQSHTNPLLPRLFPLVKTAQNPAGAFLPVDKSRPSLYDNGYIYFSLKCESATYPKRNDRAGNRCEAVQRGSGRCKLLRSHR